jgi:probable HAF family extracellular repeat protein
MSCRLLPKVRLLIALSVTLLASTTAAALPSPATHIAVIEVLPISPTALSPDGWFVAGGANGQAYRWDATNGAIALGQLPGGLPDSIATGVSADGNVVVGTANGDPNESGLRGERAFRWTPSTGMVSLGYLSANVFGRTYSQANAVSPDGLTIVGDSTSISNAGEPFRWTAAGGMDGLGTGNVPAHSSNSADAHAISGDGRTIVGISRGVTWRAFAWTPDAGFQFPSGLNADLYLQEATAVSYDGSTIVGQADVRTGIGLHAFVWSAATGAIDIGDLPGFLDRSIATGVSADGSAVIGNAYTSTFGADTEAFIWDSAGGIRNLRTWLIDDFGLDLTQWHLETATAISHDGLTIVGAGRLDFDSGNWRLRFIAISEPHAAALILIGLLAGTFHTWRPRRATL